MYSWVFQYWHKISTKSQNNYMNIIILLTKQLFSSINSLKKKLEQIILFLKFRDTRKKRASPCHKVILPNPGCCEEGILIDMVIVVCIDKVLIGTGL